MELFGISISPWWLLYIAAVVLSVYIFAPVYVALWKDMRKYRNKKYGHEENSIDGTEHG